eukprot:g56686.t1
MKEHDVGEDTCEELDKPFTQEEAATAHAVRNSMSFSEYQVNRQQVQRASSINSTTASRDYIRQAYDELLSGRRTHLRFIQHIF